MRFVDFTALAIGGAVGTLGRYCLGTLINQLASDSSFPWGTFVVNGSGCFIIGLLAGLWSNTQVDPAIRLFLTTGVLGGFTTFSTFSLETIQLWKNGKMFEAVSYGTLSPVLSIALAWIGFAFGYAR